MLFAPGVDATYSNLKVNPCRTQTMMLIEINSVPTLTKKSLTLSQSINKTRLKEGNLYAGNSNMNDCSLLLSFVFSNNRLKVKATITPSI